MFDRLKQYFQIKLYPTLFLSAKPLLFGVSGLFLLGCFGVWMGWFRAPLLSINAFEAIPTTTTLVFDLKSKKGFKEKLSKTKYLADLQGIAPIERWLQEMSEIDSLFYHSKTYKNIADKSRQVSAVQLNGTDDFAWLHVLQLNGQRLSLKKLMQELGMELKQKSNYLGSELFEYEHPKYGAWTVCHKRGLLLMSRHTTMIDAALAELNNVGSNLLQTSSFRFLRSNVAEGAMAIYVNFEMASIFLSMLGPKASLSSDPMFKPFAWAGGTLRLEEQNFVLSGKMQHKPDGGFWDWLSEQPSNNKIEIAKFIPDNLSFLYFLNSANFSNFYRKQAKELLNPDFNKYILPWLGAESAFFITEPTSFDFSADKFVVLKTKDSTKTRRLLQEYGNAFGVLDSGEFKSIRVTQLSATNLLDPIFGKQISTISNPYYAIIGDYVIFCNSAIVMELWVESYLAGKNIEQAEIFKPFSGQLKQSSSIYLLINTVNSAQLLKYFCAPEFEKFIDARFLKFRALSPLGIQLGGLGGNSFSLTVSVARNAAKQNSTSNIAWRCQLKADAATTPAVVKNSETGQFEILVQDKENRVYLISRAGKLLWEKPIDSRIISEIHQVDYYNNHQLYYAFNTEKAIYVLDSKGETVKKIPLVTKASNGLNCFSYEKDLRFYVACANGKVYGYDKNGKPLSGWNPNNNIGAAQFQMQYYEPDADNGFMIAMNRKGRLHLANRKGESVKTHFLDGYYLSGFQIDENAKRIVLCNSTGTIYVINFLGKKFSIAPSNGQNKEVHFVLADFVGDEQPEFIRQSKKLLLVHGYDAEGKINELLRYEYDFPQDNIFALKLLQHDKTCIGSYELARNQINIIDASGKKLSGFPMEADGMFVVLDLFQDNSNSLVFTKGKQLIASKLK